MRLSNVFSIFSAAAVSVKLPQTQVDENRPHYHKVHLKEARKKSKKLVKQLMNEVGVPGLVVAVSVDGTTVWSQGFGLSDVENKLSCKPSSVMRVASISKSFTALAMASLWEDGKIDLDKPIQEYVPEFPEKYFDDSKVTITLRQLLSHTSGIRHYSKNLEESKGEFDLEEYYIAKPCKSVSESLLMFKDDPLLKKPGQEFLYTTHGWTLISAILEKASGKDFLLLMGDFFRRMGMTCTVPDVNNKLIYNRSRYYQRKKNGRLENVPQVDNSYKWAGGGFLSTVADLIKFGNVMIYSYQVQKMWQGVATPERKSPDALENARYGLGWAVFHEQECRGYCPDVNLEVSHSGGAVGASSVLFLIPNTPPHNPSVANIGSKSHSGQKKNAGTDGSKPPLRGVVVAIMCNLQSVGLTNVARSIARQFDELLRT